MRALLDENMPRAPVSHLAPEIEARTVPREGWSGKRNGELLALAAARCDPFETTDRGIPHHVNVSHFGIGIILQEGSSNRAENLVPLMVEVKAIAASVSPGSTVRVA